MQEPEVYSEPQHIDLAERTWGKNEISLEHIRIWKQKEIMPSMETGIFYEAFCFWCDYCYYLICNRSSIKNISAHVSCRLKVLPSLPVICVWGDISPGISTLSMNKKLLACLWTCKFLDLTLQKFCSSWPKVEPRNLHFNIHQFLTGGLMPTD